MRSTARSAAASIAAASIRGSARSSPSATSFVTPYAATGVDEYFAESLRAYVEANDPASPWPRATRARLRHADPAMLEFVESLFEREFGSAAARVARPRRRLYLTARTCATLTPAARLCQELRM